MVENDINSIGAADAFRNRIFVGLGNQSACCCWRNSLAPCVRGDDIAEDVHVDILSIQPLCRVIVAIVGLRTEDAVLKHPGASPKQ